MSAPDYIFPLEQRTRHGALKTHDMQLIRGKLLHRGFILLPSDTCYSIAMIPHEESRILINAMLDRQDTWPVSIAFSSIMAARSYVRLGLPIIGILESFTPGPITVVCPVGDEFKFIDFATKSAGSPDRTIGVRIPDSPIERDVAAITEYPITTVAVRDRHGEEIRSFPEALETMTMYTEFAGNPGWYAVPGSDDSFYSRHSTVVRVGGADGVSLVRAGDIPFADIQESLKLMPAAAFEDEG